MKAFCVTLLIVFTFSTSYSQRIFKFKIDNQDYNIEEKELNTLFANVFNSLIANNSTKDKYFTIWVGTFSEWKSYSSYGVWVYELYGNRIAKSSFQGSMPDHYLGWKSPGKPATGNPNELGNTAKRMSLFYYFFDRELIYYCTKQNVI
jgi:hypothetical protein